jgi:hypothetical protein
MPLSVKPHELMCSERVKPIRVAGLVAELDLEGVLGKNLYDGTDLASRKTELRHIREECDGVEKLNR